MRRPDGPGEPPVKRLPPGAHRERPPLVLVVTAFVILAGALGGDYLSRNNFMRSAPRREAGREGIRKGSDSISPGRAQAEGENRGRSASAPSQIPWRGWKDILLRVYNNISEHRILANAAGITFYALLAIFPAIAALVSIYGLFADANTIETTVSSMSGILPGGAIDVVGEQLHHLTAQGGGKLGFTFVVGLAISLWSANAGMKAVFDALNIVYGEKEKRGFIKLNAISLAFTLGTLVLASIATAAVVVLPVVLDRIGVEQMTDLVMKVGRWPVLLVGIALAIALIYRYGPSRQKARWRWITWGSAFASCAWLAASILFSWYAANFGSYNKTYGSLGAAVGFMTWIWLSMIVVLLGAELDAEMEHQTMRDTTTGRPKPLGARGATMADTVGAPQH